jgi:hypothetical protein
MKRAFAEMLEMFRATCDPAWAEAVVSGEVGQEEFNERFAEWRRGQTDPGIRRLIDRAADELMASLN